MHPFSDTRLDTCCYCGGPPESRDHVPSKVFLDQPYPANLPLVYSCIECNNSFSQDEQYVACALECMIHNTTETGKLLRNKIKKAIEKDHSLKHRIEKSRGLFANHETQEIPYELERKGLENVLLKLARGHARFENSEHYLDEPTHFSYKYIDSMSEDELATFTTPLKRDILPELGSRAFLKAVLSENHVYSVWNTVQKGNYCYFVHPFAGGIMVRLIIFDYLLCQVIWE